MSPTNTQFGAPLAGLDRELAARPMSSAPDGGIGGLTGTHQQPSPNEAQEGEPQQPFAGMGPFLEDEDADVFKAIHGLVRRQEPLAKNRLAMDKYYTACKNGSGLFYRLEKVQDRDEYQCTVAPGANNIVAASTPNNLGDLCNKVVETLLVDPPQPSPQAEDDSEEAERAVEMAEEFLTQDGGEAGTRDGRYLWNMLDGATSKSAQFGHYWVDATGGGSVPLQIKAHPQAMDVQNPLVGPDGNPPQSGGYILRYVTADEKPQFTTDPSQAARQWLPKIRIDYLGREHVRCYPETADLADCEMAIVLHFCTVGEAKRRWPDTVGEMNDTAIGTLCDWTPLRYLQLLPPALRARWKLADADAGKDAKGTYNDERVLFYYLCYRRSTPLYPRGCYVAVSGANTGTILGKDTLSAEVEQPTGGTDLRVLDIPLVQWDLVLDADDRDPMAKPLAARISGASSASATLAAGFLQAIDTILNPATYTPVTSPVTGDDVAQSRATGDHIQVLSKDDYPHYEDPRPLPPNTVDVLEYLRQSMDGAMGVSAASTGADRQQEVSGVARSIAVQQANVALSRMQQGVASSYERHGRIKLQLVTKHFTAPQQIRYVGEDGAYKQEWFTGIDFARVTDVKVQAGTNTMMTPQAKLQYIQSMQTAGYVGADDAADAARPTFTGTLGLPPDPQQQRVESQVSVWLKGPPNEQWLPQAQAFNQAKQVADQQNAAAQQQYQAQVQPIQAQQQADQQNAVTAKLPVPAQSTLPPPPQPVQPMDPQTGQPLPPPWTPFGPLPMDDEPMIAALRQRRLTHLMATPRFGAQPPEWQQLVIVEYGRMRNAVAASQAPPPLPKGVSIKADADAGTIGQTEQAATHPKAA